MIIGNIPEFRNSLLLLEEILDYLNTEVIFDYLLANMFFWIREKWELEIRNNPEFGQGAYASSVLCQSKSLKQYLWCGKIACDLICTEETRLMSKLDFDLVGSGPVGGA